MLVRMKLFSEFQQPQPTIS